MSRALHNDPPEFQKTLHWREPVSPARFSRAAVVSVLIHLVAFIALWLAPETHFRAQPAPNLRIAVRQPVKLYLPKSLELTQKQKNEGKVSQELDVTASLQSKPAPRSFQPPAPPGPATRTPSPTPALAPPDIDLKIDIPQIAGMAGTPTLPRPEDKPSMVLENVVPAPSVAVPANPSLRAPKATIGDLPRDTGKAGGGGGGVFSDGDNGDPTSVGNLQLLSDPQNVDFKPYMLQVLNAVRRQWFNVIPAIARTGRQGIVVLQFSVDRKGQVPKLVIANTSGTVAFDQAAVASVSASHPFPPLPAEYTGTEIRLQLAFSYNVPRAR
jgi:TonB family protein